MTAPRPRIAITTGNSPAGDHVWLRNDYLEAVLKAHGLPMILAPGFHDPLEGASTLAGEILDSCDGLLLSGGDDIDPKHFGERPHPKLGPVDKPRDVFEITLTREAVQRNMPILAICRGVQVLNVAMGGGMIQDIPSEVAGALPHSTSGDRAVIAHDVDVRSGTLLADLLGATKVGVNTFHHQAAGRLGKGLIVSATSSDGVIEGMEIPDRDFVVGVQWHPENFWKTDAFDRLFAGFVEAARKSRDTHASRRT